MESKLSLVVLFGGQSAEHEVSRSSAAYIIDTLSTCPQYRILPVGISREGRWYAYSGPTEAMRQGTWMEEGPLAPAYLTPDTGKPYLFVQKGSRSISYPVDCVFPVLHGLKGEDGTVQGLLELAGIPYVGCGHAASALAMDKVLAKKLFDQEGIPQTPWRSLDSEAWLEGGRDFFDDLVLGLQYPLFIKPARGGSSLGISRVEEGEGPEKALDLAFSYDRKLVIEEGVPGRELEIAALGAYGSPILSPVGEIIPDRSFYDYDSKYQESSQSRLIVPAPLTEEEDTRLREMAGRAWRALDCYGLARIDFFLARDGRLLLNEINTMPGFVQISMYPRLFRAAGYDNAGLLKELIDLALARKGPKAK